MSQPLLCVTVAARTIDALRARRDASTEADLVELRLDSLERPDVPGALAGRAKPVIVTCRPWWEGGQFRGSEEERRRLLQQAVTLGAEYVDIEWRAGFHDLVRQRDGRGVVISTHDFEGVPADLPDRYRAMRATGAEVVKMAVMADRLTDMLPLMELGGDTRRRHVLIAMGAAGLSSRILAARFGSRWTYAGWQGAGQLSPDRMLDEFRFRAARRDTPVYAVVGKPIAHSVSPALHNAGFEERHLDAVYVPLEASDAGDFLQFASAIDLRGASVTAPFKVDLMPRVDEVSPDAQRIGAINTLLRRDGRWLGTNTDAPAFLEPLVGRFDLRDARATIVGAGGAARAVAVALQSAGAQVTVCARDRQKAQRVADLVGGAAADLPPAAGSWDLLVNATPAGTFPATDETPLRGFKLDGRVVYDLVYNPTRTRLLADAAAAGCDTVGGLDMLVAQAELQFELWTGVRPGPNTFRDAAIRRLSAICAERDMAELSA